MIEFIKDKQKCIICGKEATCLARYTKEPLCNKCITIDEVINLHKGKIQNPFGKEE